MLSRAHTSVVVDLAYEINTAAHDLAPKHYDAVRWALQRVQTSGVSHQLLLADAIRLRRVTFSSRALWLLRVVSTEGSVEQIDTRLVDSRTDLMTSGLGDLRELTRVLGRSKAIPLNAFLGRRRELPVGGWASNIRLGAMRGNVAEVLLKNPEAWPGALVQRAVEHVEERMLADLKPIAVVAEEDDWFS